MTLGRTGRNVSRRWLVVAVVLAAVGGASRCVVEGSRGARHTSRVVE